MPVLPMLIAMSHPPARLTACAATDIAVSTDGADGAFNGMSQSGTLLILRNTGRRPCTVPGLPKVTFLSAGAQAFPIDRRAPVGMHPGPVVLPVTIAPDAIVSTPLHWVAGPVYTKNRCYDAARVSVTIGAQARTADLSAHICGDADKGMAGFDQPVLQPGHAAR